MTRKLKLFCTVLLVLFALWLMHWCWVSADRWANQPITAIKVGDVFFMVMWVSGIYYLCHGRKPDGR